MWLPTPFIGFFSHHDGLMVTTVMQVRQALQEHHPWPFNQYGPSWALFFGTILSDVPGSYLLISMRLIVLAGYAVTAFFTYKTARLFGGQNFSLLSLILLTANQPFVFDLLPWPSAFVMPIVSIFAFLIISIVGSENSDKINHNRKLFISGSLIPLIIMSRIQVGCLLFVVGIWAVFTFQKRRPILSFLSGFAVSSTIAAGFLAQKGWLTDVIRDQVVFGSSYLHSENNPLPKITLASVLLILILMLLAKKFHIKNFGLKFQGFESSIFLLCALFFVTVLAISTFTGASNLQTLITRKLWVSVPLACMAYMVLRSISRDKKNFARKGLVIQDNRKMVLLLMSIATYSQIFPLFDQMHSWWGYAPSVILVSLVLQELTENFDKSHIQKMQSITVSVVTILAAINLTVQFQNNIPLKTTNEFSLIFISKGQVSEMSKLQSFFSESMPSKSRVLNLCENTDVFFNDQFISSASRVFLYWRAMEKSEYLIKEIKRSKPDYVILCRNLEISRSDFTETGAPRVLGILNGKFTRVNLLRSNFGYEWIVYKHGISS
ncbi:hypothetical protein MCEBLUE5_00027 [Candidatus Planktophila versatilis]